MSRLTLTLKLFNNIILSNTIEQFLTVCELLCSAIISKPIKRFENILYHENLSIIPRKKGLIRLNENV